MKRTLNFWQIAGFIFTAIAGTLLHFVYDWSKESFLLAPFCATNESTWEHMKLLFFPAVIFALVENYFTGKSYQNFLQIKCIGILSGLSFIPIFFYTYTGVLGVIADWFNITIFFLSVFLMFFLETQLLKKNSSLNFSEKTASVILMILTFAFIIFTFLPPKIPLFQDPDEMVFYIK